MSDTQNVVSQGKVVSFAYVLTGPDGGVLDRSPEGATLSYLHGAGNIVPGLEGQMSGHAVGDAFTAVVPPAEAYGEPRGPGEQAVPLAAFPEGAELFPGLQVMAEDPDGNPIPLWITRVEDDTVFVDINHPLAGVTLTFQVEVAEIRDATPEELSHGHVHGPSLEGGPS